MLEGVDKLAGSVGKTIETVPDIYDDALKPTTQESGKILALIPRAINAALVPLRQWIANKEYNLAETEKLLAQKLEHVNEDKIVTPEPYVAVPAIQAISYSMNSEELRNLYANLLAKAMNADTKEAVHPSFVEIIKQLSPVDSLVFKTIMERTANPLIDLIYENDKYESYIISTNISDINVSSEEIVSISIDNLIRQSLISIPDDSFYTNEHAYDSIINSEYYKAQQIAHPNTLDGFRFAPQKRIINKTNLGAAFYKICVLDQ